LHLSVERFVSDADTTVSLIFLGGLFECFGLEDEFREEKLMHETRIPAGTYVVVLRQQGGFHVRYLADTRFSSFHQGMLEIEDVPGFTDILIHVGNTDDDTSGCLLIGESAICPPYAEKSVVASARAYERLYKKVVAAAKKRDLTITFIDRDLAQNA